jgi:hypothetical protein
VRSDVRLLLEFDASESLDARLRELLDRYAGPAAPEPTGGAAQPFMAAIVHVLLGADADALAALDDAAQSDHEAGVLRAALEKVPPPAPPAPPSARV